jgi:hypothetical protein
MGGLKTMITVQAKIAFPAMLPPGLPGKVVKNLVVSFCKVQEKDLDKKLNKKSKAQEKGKEDVGQSKSLSRKGKESEAAGSMAPQQKKKKSN